MCQWVQIAIYCIYFAFIYLKYIKDPGHHPHSIYSWLPTMLLTQVKLSWLVDSASISQILWPFSSGFARTYCGLKNMVCLNADGHEVESPCSRRAHRAAHCAPCVAKHRCISCYTSTSRLPHHI